MLLYPNKNMVLVEKNPVIQYTREASPVIDLIGMEWFKEIGSEFRKPYMSKLNEFITERRKINTVYPPRGLTFNAYRLTPYNKVKVCIIGQDPYIHALQADGLAFSTLNNTQTPTLWQIEHAVRRDVRLPENYKWVNNLTRWAKQGVFLLNTVLTVDAGKSNSHKGNGWERFTLETVRRLDDKGVIFLLWGVDARYFRDFIKNPKSTVFIAEHPVSASYHNKTWANDNCFGKVNDLLEEKINW